MKGKTLFRSIIWIVILSFVSSLAGCADSASFGKAIDQTSTEERLAAANKTLRSLDHWDLLVLSDSSAWGLAEPLGEAIEKDTGIPVTVHDYWISSLQAARVAESLREGKSAFFKLEKLPALIKEAEVIVFFANPVGSVSKDHPFKYDCTGSCRKPVDCSEQTYEVYRSHLDTIYQYFFELRGGEPTIIRALDFYNPLTSWWQSCSIVNECTHCWEVFNGEIAKAAEAYNIPVVHRYDAFNGKDHLDDPRVAGYIKEDGEHPSDAGNAVVIELIRAIGYDPVITK